MGDLFLNREENQTKEHIAWSIQPAKTMDIHSEPATIPRQSRLNGAGKMSIRVLRIITRLNIGGPAIHTILLNAGLAERGFDCLLLTGQPAHKEGDMSYLAERYQVHVEVVDELGREIRPLQDAISIAKTLRVVRRFKPHIVHTHTAKAGFMGRLAAVLAGVPVRVHTFHGHVFHSYFSPAKTALFLNLERGLAAVTNRLIAISTLQKTELAERYRVAPSSKFDVIPLGFQHLNDLADGRKTLRSSARRELGVDGATAVVGIIGRLVPVKDHTTFLEAAARLVRWRPDTRFLVVGDGPLKTALQVRAQRLGIDNHVQFLGWRRNLTPVYAAMDLCCLSSRNEGTPVAVIEALAAGVPVVATAVGGVPDVLHNGKWGRMTPAGHPSALAQAMFETLSDPLPDPEAQVHTLNHFSAQRLLNDVESLYIRLLKQAGIRSVKKP